MNKKYNIAVVGATGNVGREIIQIIGERDFPYEEIYFVASERSKGKKIDFKDKEIVVHSLAEFDFSSVDIALFSPGSKVSAEYAPKAAKKGCIVIDNTSFFRMHKNVPLIVPEINESVLTDYFDKEDKLNIIANPNCSTIQMVLALKPLHDISIINRVVVSTYQSVSGKGKDAMDELFEQTKSIYANKPIEKKQFTKQIAFNVIPHIDDFLDSGNTKEEQKMIDETKKIIDDKIEISATCVRVPVFIGHSESVNIEFESSVSIEQVKEALENFPGISVIDYRKDEGYVTPVEIAGDDKVYVSRIRKDESKNNSLNMWIVSDNLRKGAALNTIQIAETIIEKNLI